MSHKHMTFSVLRSRSQEGRYGPTGSNGVISHTAAMVARACNYHGVRIEMLVPRKSHS